MTQTEQRSNALGVVRSVLRQQGINPLSVSADDAHLIIDDFARQHPDRLAAYWYRSASEREMMVFYREWRRWQKFEQYRLGRMKG